MNELILATRNAHKTSEIAAMLGPLWTVRDLTTLPDFPEPKETGSTFQENAEIKALSASALTGALVLADDSGLEVNLLEGAPGVYSARYAGSAANDDANRNKLVSELARIGALESPARFHCALALAQVGKIIANFHGTVEGKITINAHGRGGFGYDPLFIPEGFAITFGEFTPEAKNAISHRARALRQFMSWSQNRDRPGEDRQPCLANAGKT